jgi:hypothetical protein
MSPYIRTMLEDAADDGGRPVTLDLTAIKAAGRRATWRRRALVAGSGLGAAAIVTSVALLLAPSGAAPFGPATGSTTDESKPEPTDGALGDPADALAEAFAPLIDALRDQGLDVEVEYGSSTGSASSGEGSATQTASATGLTVKHADSVGAAVVAEFTDRSALGLGGDDDLLCAEPPVRAEDFTWETCDPHGDNGEYLLATGGDALGDAVGVTLVRFDGSGISVALSTSAYDPAQSEPPASPLAKLPLTHLELVEIVAQLDARAPMWPPTLPGPTVSGEPPPDPDSTATAAPAPTCPDGDVLAEIVDATGQSVLVKSGGLTWYCLVGSVPDSPTDAADVTNWTAEDGALEAWQFGLAYSNMCAKTEPCSGELWYGAGAIPDEVVRLTFEMPDGATIEAKIVDNLWLVRHAMDAEDFSDLPPVIVRAYAADGSVLLEGDVNAPPG